VRFPSGDKSETKVDYAALERLVEQYLNEK
jgi:hypothetical protein